MIYDLFCKAIANYLFYFVSLCDSQLPGDGKILFFCVNCMLQICRKKSYLQRFLTDLQFQKIKHWLENCLIILLSFIKSTKD